MVAGQIGFEEQLFGALKTAAHDFRENSTSDRADEASFQRAARDSELLVDIADAHHVSRLVANDLQRPSDHGVILGDHVGGLPDGHVSRLHPDHLTHQPQVRKATESSSYY